MLRSLLLFLIAVVAALIVAGCGGGSDSTPTPTPTPVHGNGSWSAQFSGALSGELDTNDAFTSCAESDGSYQISLFGKLGGAPVTMTLGTYSTGSFDYAQAPSGLAITAKYSPNTGELDFAGNGGADGASGTVTVGAAGGGTMRVTIPRTGGGDAIMVNATWTCS